MDVFKTILGVWGGSVGVTLFAWLIVHFNGKTLLGILDVFGSLNRKTPNWRQIATEAEVIIVGLTPLAIAALVSTQGNCHHSIIIFLIAETIILGLFLLVSLKVNWHYFWGKQNNYQVFILAIVWCLVFSIWGVLAINPTEHQGVDRLLINQNGDMWFYLRRFAAYTVDHLSFDHQPACNYLQLSPKKLSSFIGSIIVYLSPNTVTGITLFQGLLGCSLFLSLFGHWCNFTYQNRSLSQTGTIWAIAWAVFSPAIFWLLISSYLSNALFITIFVLSLTSARRICLKSNLYPTYAALILLFCLIVCIFSFYLVLLPVALIFYMATLIIYQYEQYLNLKVAVINLSKIMLVAGISILFCRLLFPAQINLTEVSDNLNTLQEHGKNILPLNPWSLVQEKPKPMPKIKDFGLWFHLVVGMIFSGLVFKNIYRYLVRLCNEDKAQTFYYKDLIAAALVLGVYVLYLGAYIPLEHTYRLGKFAISILYPLAILSILPVLLWFRDRHYLHKPRLFKLTCSVLIILHIILHIDKTLYLEAQPIGKYHIASINNLKKINSLTVVRCQKSSFSQQYEKIVGLDIAKQYPHLAINVITGGSITNLPQSKMILKGVDVKSGDEDLCIFNLKS